MKSKIIISSLIVILVGASGYLLLSQKSTPIIVEQPISQNLSNTEQTISPTTTDWKTYKNEKYGFEFKYPKEFSVNTVSEADVSGGDCGYDGCGDGIEEWNISNGDEDINIQIDSDLKNFTQQMWWYDSESYLKYENGRMLACDKKECLPEAISLDSKELDADGNSIIKQGKNWKAFVVQDIYGSGPVKEYLIPNLSKNSMIKMRVGLDKNLVIEKIIDSLLLLK